MKQGSGTGTPTTRVRMSSRRRCTYPAAVNCFLSDDSAWRISNVFHTTLEDRRLMKSARRFNNVNFQTIQWIFKKNTRKFSLGFGHPFIRNRLDTAHFGDFARLSHAFRELNLGRNDSDDWWNRRGRWEDVPDTGCGYAFRQIQFGVKCLQLKLCRLSNGQVGHLVYSKLTKSRQTVSWLMNGPVVTRHSSNTTSRPDGISWTISHSPDDVPWLCISIVWPGLCWLEFHMQMNALSDWRIQSTKLIFVNYFN